MATAMETTAMAMAMANDAQRLHWELAQSIKIGADLISAAKSQLFLLSAVDAYPLHGLYRGPTVQRAIHRYENCWLPLLVAASDELHVESSALIPPLDCAWVWHCHRLNPVQYVKDCQPLFGRLLDGHMMFSRGEEDDREAVDFTRDLWNSRYPGEEYDLCRSSGAGCVHGSRRKISYNLEAAIARQSSFYYQVAGPHMGEEAFLDISLRRYKGFLYLLKLTGLSVFLVPTYDIDLMWHSHQAGPWAYREDTVQLLGRVLNHDDTDSDRSPGQKLDTGFNKTRKLWMDTFGSCYERAGAMYKGAQVELESEATELSVSCQQSGALVLLSCMLMAALHCNLSGPSSCGACGAGGCGNSIDSAPGNDREGQAKGSSCGACGAGGCGNSIDSAPAAAASAAGAGCGGGCGGGCGSGCGGGGAAA